MIRSLCFVIIIGLYAASVAGQDAAASGAKQKLLFNDPGVIQIRLEPITPKRSNTVDSPETSEPFKTGDRVNVRVITTNNAQSPVRLPISNTYIQDRPQLFRDGQLMKYKEDVEKLLETSDSEPNSLRRRSILLPPNDAKVVEVIDLANWYRPLKTGHYQLAIKHRFESGGTWIESSSTTFEVNPK